MEPLLLAFGAVAGAAITETIRAVARHDSTAAAASEQVAAGAGEVVELLRAEVARLSREVDRLRVIAQALENEIVALGGDPQRAIAQALKDRAE